MRNNFPGRSVREKLDHPVIDADAHIVECDFAHLDFVRQLEKDNPASEIAVIIPELVPRRWYEAFLHNHRAEVLKARLLLEDIERVALVNIPWYLK